LPREHGLFFKRILIIITFISTQQLPC
jgi:hypothetical protein